MREAEGALIVGRVNTVNVGEVVKRFERMRGITREAAIKALEAGGDEAARLISSQAQMLGLRKTGKMIRSIRRGAVSVHYDSATVDVYPSGTYKGSRKRVAVAAFIQHYGRSYGRRRRSPTEFFDLKGYMRDAVNDRIEEVWKEESDSGNG